MNEPQGTRTAAERDDDTTLTDEEVETRNLRTGVRGAARPMADDGDDTGDTGDDSGDPADASDTGDDSGDVSDTGDDAGDDGGTT